MHGIEFLQDLAVVMIVAGLVAVIFHRLKQPVVLGYIIAGVIVGPYTPPFPLIHNAETISTLSELGVIFLMFSLGLEFSLRKLKAVGATAFIAAFLEILLMVWLGYEIGLLFGWSNMDSLFLGAILSISSTTIIVKALNELGKAKERFSELIFGILIVEDILGIVMIALLSGIAATGSLKAGDAFMTIGKLGVFLVAVLVVGLLAVPKLLTAIGRSRSNEMLLVAVLGLCFGVCLLAAKLGYSVALGAFLIGAIIAESREIIKIERLVEPLRDMFSAVFFVAIGLLIQPKLLVEYAFPIAVITVAVVVGKVMTCSFGAFVAGNDSRTALRVGMGLAQIGEFSFIIASLGLSLKVTSEFLYPIAVTVSAITTFLTPYLIKSSDHLVSKISKLAPAPVANYLSLYTRWVGGQNTHNTYSRNAFAARQINKWIWQMGLNVALMVALFAIAASIAKLQPTWLPALPGGIAVMNGALWGTAMLISIPFLIATFRKLQALGMLVSELTVSQTLAGQSTANIRAIIAQAIPLAGLIGMGLLILTLSSAILPPTNVLVVLAIILVIVAIVLWRSFIRIYSKFQFALSETFSAPESSHRHQEPEPVSYLLKHAELKTIAVAPESPAQGKLISEIRLRTVSGASIVAIQRGDQSIINPEATEELRSGDQLLLLGTTQQLHSAEAALLGKS